MPALWSVHEAALTLPSGDEADLYAPQVRSRMRDLLEDAFPVLTLLQGALVGWGRRRTGSPGPSPMPGRRATAPSAAAMGSRASSCPPPRPLLKAPR